MCNDCSHGPYCVCISSHLERSRLCLRKVCIGYNHNFFIKESNSRVPSPIIDAMVWWGEFAETVGSAWTYLIKPGLIVCFEAHFWFGTYHGFEQMDAILFSSVSKCTHTSKVQLQF